MSEELADSDSSCEWTFINDEGEASEISKENEESTSTNSLQNDNLSLERKNSIVSSDELHPDERDFETEDNDTVPSASTSSSSDIEHIDEDGEILSFESSVLTESSKFSFLSPCDVLEVDLESLVSNDSVSVISEENNSDNLLNNNNGCEVSEGSNLEQIRIYKHVPNRRLNLSLNLLLALSITAVIGLGVGHFLGWSSQWIHQHHIHQSQVTKLKALQDELIMCLQQQNNLENNVNIQEGEPHYHFKDLRGLEGNLEEELHNDEAGERAMAVLLKENEELQLELNKLHFEKESSVDQEAKRENNIIRLEVGSLRQQINQLQLENEDLRRVIARLRYGRPLDGKPHLEQQKTLKLEDEKDAIKIETIEIQNQNPIKDVLNINSKGQNSKFILINPPAYSVKNNSEIISLQTLVKKLRKSIELERNETKKWKNMCQDFRYEENRNNNSKHGILSWFSYHISNVTMEKLLNLLDILGLSYEDNFKTMFASEDEIKLNKTWLQELRNMLTNDSILNQIQKSLQEKWIELKNFSTSDDKKSSKNLFKKLNKVLKKTVHKFQAIGQKIMKPSKKSIKKLASNFMNKLNNLVVKLDQNWFNVKSKFSFFAESSKSDVKDDTALKSGENDGKENKAVFHQQSSKYSEKDKPKKNSIKHHHAKSYVEKEKQKGEQYSYSAKDSNKKANKKKDGKIKKDKKESVHHNKENQSITSYIDDEGDDRDQESGYWYFEREPLRENWIFYRGRSREGYRQQLRHNDWYFDRARDREKQHRIRRSEFHNEWFVRRAKGRDFQRSKTINENDWFLKRGKDNFQYWSTNKDYYTGEEQKSTKEKRRERKNYKDAKKKQNKKTSYNFEQSFSVPDIHHDKAYFTSCDV